MEDKVKGSALNDTYNNSFLMIKLQLASSTSTYAWNTAQQ